MSLFSFAHAVLSITLSHRAAIDVPVFATSPASPASPAGLVPGTCTLHPGTGIPAHAVMHPAWHIGAPQPPAWLASMHAHCIPVARQASTCTQHGSSAHRAPALPLFGSTIANTVAWQYGLPPTGMSGPLTGLDCPSPRCSIMLTANAVPNPQSYRGKHISEPCDSLTVPRPSVLARGF